VTTATRRPAWRRAAWLVGGFLLVALPTLTRPALLGGDEIHYALIARSLAADFDLDLLNQYREVQEGAPWAGRRQAGKILERHVRPARDGAELPAHPPGWPALVAPLLALQWLAFPTAAPDYVLLAATLGLVAAALWAALATARERDERGLVLATFFSTPLWFYGRTFFAEPATAALLVLTVAALRVRRDRLAALALAATLVTKETAVLAAVPLALAAVLLRDRSEGRSAARQLAASLATGAAAAALLLVTKNLATGQGAWATSYPFHWGDPASGAVGLLLDPRHGLLAFAPLLALGVFGFLLRPRDAEDRIAGWASLAVFAGYFAITASWADWSGGACYGPRLLLPALPALFVPTLRLWRASPRVGRTFLILAGGAGAAVALSAAAHPFDAMWSASVVEVLMSWK
jgi:hypothetical protein